jgi:hypothetical protein
LAGHTRGHHNGGNIKDETITDADIAPGAIKLDVRIVRETKIIAANSFGYAYAQCPDFQTPITGGGFATLSGVRILESIPLGAPPYAWYVRAFNADNTNIFLDAYAICTKLSG